MIESSPHCNRFGIDSNRNTVTAPVAHESSPLTRDGHITGRQATVGQPHSSKYGWFDQF